MAGLIFVIGGAQSGKSFFAESLAQKIGKQKIYIATALVWDQEMATRIKIHRARRGVHWKLFETPISLNREIQKKSMDDCVILVDCLTLWLSNLIHFKKDVMRECDNLLLTLQKKKRGTERLYLLRMKSGLASYRGIVLLGNFVSMLGG